MQGLRCNTDAFGGDMAQAVESCDVLVAGGGVIGVCVAYYCSAAGAKVILVERDAVGAGCSYGNAGLIVPSYSVPLPTPEVLRKALSWLWGDSPLHIKPRFDVDLFRWLVRFAASCNMRAVRAAIPLLRDLARASVRLYDQILSDPDFECGHERKGLLVLYNTSQGHKAGESQAAMLREFEIDSKPMSVVSLREKVPGIRNTLVGGTYYPEDSHLAPSDFVRHLAARAENNGVKIYSGTPVESLLLRDSRVSAVLTSRGVIKASHFVIACGAWSPGLLDSLRVRLPVQPAKGYSVTIPSASQTRLDVPLILHEAKVAVTPMNAAIRLAGMLELNGLDTSIDAARVQRMLVASGTFLSGLDQAGSITPWAGLRPCSPDGLPMIGRLRQHENVITATGHGMLGMTLGPITGELVSEMIFHRRPTVDVHRLRPERFR
jgi:D-amino-acid dehydrogenase